MFKICVSGRHRSAVGKRVLGMPHPTHIRHQSAGPTQLATLLQLQLPAKESGKKVAAGLSMGGPCYLCGSLDGGANVQALGQSSHSSYDQLEDKTMD